MWGHFFPSLPGLQCALLLVLAALALLFTVLDWLQTIQIFNHQYRWRETNPLINMAYGALGKLGVHLWFAGVILVVGYAVWYTWVEFKFLVLAGAFVMEAYHVHRNRYKFSIPFFS